jgi:hypothetical protein
MELQRVESAETPALPIGETLGKLFFDSEYLGWFIDVFLATHIASDSERSVDRGA